MELDQIMGSALDARRRKPRIGMIVVYYVDGPATGRVFAAKVVRVIDRDTVLLQLSDGERRTATFASPSGIANVPRPAGSWDFIV